MILNFMYFCLEYNVGETRYKNFLNNSEKI